MNYTPLTYSDLQIQSRDMEFIDSICDTFHVSIDDVDLRDAITYILDKSSPSADLTNYIISQLMFQIAGDQVENEDDLDLIQGSIYTNCLDSFYNVDQTKLKTKQAKDFVEKFNAL